ncbi:MAG: DUF58 domain-containing protein [Planctomycetota bacterium]|nr:MAG: DUF58 domain-containing protein [Planctomycetota bacterium]REK20366.1 MAG: DUF58 domain-containing protein [Planctomycetota bacterium]REK26863.1 MAG: DUF58 domain-containing protein [Planctomycetota bacterium]
MPVSQFTTLLPNDVLARVERMRLNPIRRQTNRMRGEHLSSKGGTSIEFADYRDYVAGDDIRYVDWNIFSRLNHPYLKLFAHEEEMHVVILLDASQSMLFEEKFDLARQAAAALGVMGLMNVERVSVYSCASLQSEPVIMPPVTGRASLQRFLKFLEGLAGGGAFPVEQAIEEVLKRHRGRGVAIVLSDFLTLGDLTRGFNLLHNAGLEIYGLQILGPSEIDPELTGDLRFIDSETQQTLDVSSVGELLGIYHEHRLALEAHLSAECRKRSGRFLSVSSDEPIKSLLFDRLLRKGWVR